MQFTETSYSISGPVRDPILQIHPSLRCNLRCRHCYSESHPQSRERLDPEYVCQAVSDASAMGYKIVSVSGGEPFLYKELPTVLQHAKSVGMRTTVTTNGYFLQEQRLQQLAGCVDVIAISLDGMPETHNQVRGSSQAFEKMQAGLENVRKAGIKFGFIHTSTRNNWDQLPWIGEFASTNGASLLQIHPLEFTGRANAEMTGLGMDQVLLAKVYLLAFAMTVKYADSMKIQCDLLHRDQVLGRPELIYASDAIYRGKALPSELLGLIVLEPDGALVPLCYGFSRQYEICNVKTGSLKQGLQDFVEDGFGEFRHLCREVFDFVAQPDGPELFNWHEMVVAKSRRYSTQPSRRAVSVGR